MKFRYHKLILQKKSEYFGSSILKPIIPISIVINNKELLYAALIDSGADFCIFDSEIGENLGINIKTGLRIDFGGIQEKAGAEAFLHDVSLGVGGLQYNTEIGFSYNIAKHGFGILGQKGFFDIFTVKFDLVKEEI